MIEHCTALHIFDPEGEAKFDREDHIAEETAAFKARVQQMQDHGVKDASDTPNQMIAGK